MKKITLENAENLLTVRKKTIWKSLQGCTASRRTTSRTMTAGKASPTG